VSVKVELVFRMGPIPISTRGVLLQNEVLVAFAKFKKRILALSCLSVSLAARNNKSAPTGPILIKFEFWYFFKNLLGRFKFPYNQTKLTGSLHK
jgi:hypothetical protein